MINLRNPRNELVIHLRRRYTLDSFSSNGTVIRAKYLKIGSRDSAEEKFELISPTESFTKIYEFLRGLEIHFLKIL